MKNSSLISPACGIPDAAAANRIQRLLIQNMNRHWSVGTFSRLTLLVQSLAMNHTAPEANFFPPLDGESPLKSTLQAPRNSRKSHELLYYGDMSYATGKSAFHLDYLFFAYLSSSLKKGTGQWPPFRNLKNKAIPKRDRSLTLIFYGLARRSKKGYSIRESLAEHFIHL